MTRYEAIERALRGFVEAYRNDHIRTLEVFHYLADACTDGEAALALPEDSKAVNAELYGLAVELADEYTRLNFQKPPIFSTWSDFESRDDKTTKYLSLRESSGDPMPYKVVRDGDKVRFL